MKISVITTYEPPWVLNNDWFGEALPRKFIQHTGILSRRVSLEDEVTMGVRAVERLRNETGCDLTKCVAGVLASSSLVRGYVGRQYVGGEQANRQRFRLVAREFASRLGIASTPVLGINWACCGYAKAMEVVARCSAHRPRLRSDQFILVVTVNRTSKITDYGCKDTGPIFGDFAQATLLCDTESCHYPGSMLLVYAAAERPPTDDVFFRYHLRENVMVPTPDGGRSVDPQRLVFSLDMMGLADGAPRAMANAAAKALRATQIRPEAVDFVVPHQAGTSIVGLTAMKLEELGIHGEVINGLTRELGNISSSSIPYALQQNWHRLHGTIICPTAAVGRPGHGSLMQGCIILKAA